MALDKKNTELLSNSLMHGDDEKNDLPYLLLILDCQTMHITSTAGLHKMLGQDILILVTDFVYHEAECYTARPIRSIWHTSLLRISLIQNTLSPLVYWPDHEQLQGTTLWCIWQIMELQYRLF